MKLDVVVPTYNRCALVRKTVLSLLNARVPAEMTVNIFVVDNASADDTASTIKELKNTAALPIHYLTSPIQGSSSARNAGIAAGSGDVIGFVDDDEEVASNWFEAISQEFKDPDTHFIGGPCLANWQAPPPDWLPPGYHSVIGVIPPKARGRYGAGHPGMLNGGNAVVRRSVFDRIGLFSARLGRTPKHLLSEEDAEFFRRLMVAGISGMYVPELIIYHYVPVERLTRRYHRRWAYWRGVSQGVLDRHEREPVAYLCGVPRHRIGRALRRLTAMPAHLVLGRTRGLAFADELATWDLLGFLHGKFIYPAEKVPRRRIVAS